MVKKNNVIGLLAALSLFVCPAAQAKPERTFTKAEVVADFADYLQFVKTTHPDIARSAHEIFEGAALARNAFEPSMSLRAAWMAMALVNPHFGDAHTGLRRPVAALKAYTDGGGRLFPADVVFDHSGALRVAPAAPRASGMKPGDEILAINGVAARDIVAVLSPRMRGETPALRRLIMARYFPQYFWVAYGGFAKYTVRLRNARGVRTVTASGTASDGAAEAGFRYKNLGHGFAYLDIPTFEGKYAKSFREFLAGAFTRIQKSGARNLIIDLRANGGGAHELSDMLMAYLSGKPYSATSRITARITKENIDRIPGAKLGSIVTIPFRQQVTPPKDFPLRFQGRVYVLIGKLTYSQAIVFAATLQDYQIAALAGEQTEGPANQSGQVQTHVLTNTGFEALAPIYIFMRSSGARGNSGVLPDIIIPDNPLAPMKSVTALQAVIAQN